MSVIIDQNKCTQCGACEGACPFGLISLVDDKVIIADGCNLCGACIDACTCDALSLESVKQETAEGHSGVWVFAEQRDGKLKSVSYELVSEGRKLADKLGAELAAVCIGHKVSDIDSLISYGADKVYAIDDASLASHQEDYYTSALVDLVNKHKPEILLAGATALGRSFIPRVA